MYVLRAGSAKQIHQSRIGHWVLSVVSVQKGYLGLGKLKLFLRLNGHERLTWKT